MAKLDSLFKQTEIKKTDAHPRRETKWLHIDKLMDNSKQYRSMEMSEETITLAELIRADNGVKQNLIVRRLEGDTYEIIAGHHRKAACKYLVEQEGLKQFEFLPCYVESLNDVHAEFELYSSNSFIPKTDYERMHEIERMKYLLETYPEEFPHLPAGRMVERLAKQLNMKKTTVGEYLSIANNLGAPAMEAFREGTITKSAAVEMAALDHKEQEQLINSGKTSHKEVKEYKASKEPPTHLINLFYNVCAKYDTDRNTLKEALIENMGKCHEGGSSYSISYRCTPRGVTINHYDEITWARLVQLINLSIPVKKQAEDKEPEAEGNVRQQESESTLAGQYTIVDTDMNMKEECVEDIKAENVPESGTKEEESCVPESGTDSTEQSQTDEYDDMYFYKKEKKELDEYLRLQAQGAKLPRTLLKRQQLIVKALAQYLHVDEA